MPEHMFVEGGDPSVKHIGPAMSFLLRHSSKKTIIFDLGIRKDWRTNFPPTLVKRIETFFAPVDISRDVVDSLRAGGLEPKDIHYVIMSHVHWDHIGNTHLFPTSEFIAGGGTKEVLENGTSHSKEDPKFNEAVFWKDTLPEGRTRYLSEDVNWIQLGPFPRAYDFFGDGSVYIIDAPGHLPGHINVLARNSPDGSWIYLGGDSAHDIRLVTGEKEVGHYHNPLTGQMACMHVDEEAAKETVRRIRDVMKGKDRVEILLAHDHVWFEENKDNGVVFPGKIPPRSSGNSHNL